MAITVTQIGCLPYPKGAYREGIPYNESNLVQYLGSTYRSLQNNNTTPPATITPDGEVKTNPGWENWVDGSAAILANYNILALSIDEITGDLIAIHGTRGSFDSGTINEKGELELTFNYPS